MDNWILEVNWIIPSSCLAGEPNTFLNMPAMMDVEGKGVERNREMRCGAKFLPGLARMSPAFYPIFDLPLLWENLDNLYVKK